MIQLTNNSNREENNPPCVLFLFTISLFAISGFSPYIEIAAIAFLFFFSLKLGVYFGIKIARHLKLQGNENSRFTPAGAVITLTMALFFLVIFLGGLTVFVILKG